MADQEITALAEQVARSAMPMGPILDAFRRVLDEQPGALRRTYRRGLRAASEGLQSLTRKALGRLQEASPSAPDQVHGAEWAALQPSLAPFVERLRGKLLAHGAGDDPAWNECVHRDLNPSRLEVMQTELKAAIETSPEAWEAYTSFCEDLVSRELSQRKNEWALQAMVDLAHLLPATVAAVIVVQSGGLLTDVAVGSAGALSSMATERLSKFLGTQTAAAARQRWVATRLEPWKAWLWKAALPSSGASWGSPDSSRWAPIDLWLEQNRSSAG